MVMTKASVAIVRGKQPSKMVETALELIGTEGLVKPTESPYQTELCHSQATFDWYRKAGLISTGRLHQIGRDLIYREYPKWEETYPIEEGGSNKCTIVITPTKVSGQLSGCAVCHFIEGSLAVCIVGELDLVPSLRSTREYILQDSPVHALGYLQAHKVKDCWS